MSHFAEDLFFHLCDAPTKRIPANRPNTRPVRILGPYTNCSKFHLGRSRIVPSSFIVCTHPSESASHNSSTLALALHQPKSPPNAVEHVTSNASSSTIGVRGCPP